MYYERGISRKLKSLVSHFPCLILTGARQTGKTTLLKHLYPSHSFVSLDLPSMAELAEKKPEEFFQKFSLPLVIDEVQYAPRIFRYLKVKIDEARDRKGQFLLTGSQKFTLMKEVSESLAGRCVLVELDTLSALEFSKGERLASADGLTFLFRGGFPELAVDPELPAADFYRSYLATYLERDVRALLQVGDLRDFERFIRMCALRSGQLLNLSELARDVGISPPTAKKWLSVLEASNQIDLLEPYFKNRTKQMIKTPKLYFRDTGLLCFLIGVASREALFDSPLIGPVWETFIYGQILREVRQRSTAAQVWYWRDTHGLEADFLIDQGGRLTLVEAKWTESATEREAGALRKIIPLLGPSSKVRGVVVCRTPNPFPLAPPIEVRNGFETESYLDL